MAKHVDEDGAYSVALLVGSKHESDGFGGSYFKVTAYPVKVYTAGLKIRNYGLDHGWNNLEVSAMGEDGAKGERGRYLYGWGVQYRAVYRADLHRVEGMLKALKTVQHGLGRLSDTRGYPRSFAEYLGRVAESLGATLIVRKVSGGSGYDDAEYRFEGLGDGVASVERLEREWRDESVKKEVTA